MARFDPKFGDEVVETWTRVEVPYTRVDEFEYETIEAWLADQSRPGFFEIGMHELFDEVLVYRISDPRVAFEFKVRFV
ncbi:MAG: hypothetical protein EOO77_41105 [Oxalobacteraceae bacterium]|nr:MAG: hypothetical protein EOO77_41105 [Oxalobacteraceae bacterium]